MASHATALGLSPSCVVALHTAANTRGSSGGFSIMRAMAALPASHWKSAIASTHSCRSLRCCAGSVAIASSTATVSGLASPRSAVTACRRVAVVGPSFASARIHAMGMSCFSVFNVASRGSNATHSGGPSSCTSIASAFVRQFQSKVFTPPAVFTITGVLTSKAGVRSSIFCVCCALSDSMRVALSYCAFTLMLGQPGRMHH